MRRVAAAKVRKEKHQQKIVVDVRAVCAAFFVLSFFVLFDRSVHLPYIWSPLVRKWCWRRNLKISHCAGVRKQRILNESLPHSTDFSFAFTTVSVPPLIGTQENEHDGRIIRAWQSPFVYSSWRTFILYKETKVPFFQIQMFSRTAIKRYATEAATSANYSGSSGSTFANAGAFVAGVMVIPTALIMCNLYPSTRRPSQVPMYNGMEKYVAKHGKDSN
jgi:hypothetical protein